FVVVDRVTCCSTIFAVTDTSGMAAPLASLTYPAMLPVAIWAAVGETARVSVNRAMTGKSQHGKSIPANRRLVRFGCKTIYCPPLGLSQSGTSEPVSSVPLAERQDRLRRTFLYAASKYD